MILFVQTWNWASHIMQAAQKFSRPIVLWATPVPRQWSIGGLAVTHGSFDEVGIEHIAVYGMPGDQGVNERIVRYARAAGQECPPQITLRLYWLPWHGHPHRAD